MNPFLTIKKSIFGALFLCCFLSINLAHSQIENVPVFTNLGVNETSGTDLGVNEQGIPIAVINRIGIQGQGIGVSQNDQAQDEACSTCEAQALTLIGDASGTNELCVNPNTGDVTFAATLNPAFDPAAMVPGFGTGNSYEVHYVLVDATGTVISITPDQVSGGSINNPNIVASGLAPGDYTLHMLVAETDDNTSENFFGFTNVSQLSYDSITLQSNATNPATIIGNGLSNTVCGDIDTPGLLFTVLAADDDRCLDTDGDQIFNDIDIDDDNDGILDTLEQNTSGTDLDSDSDGIIDRFDLDADNDGIPDNIEAFAAENYRAPATGTANANGVTYQVGSNGLHNNYETAPDSGVLPTTLVLQDSDNDGTPDFRDTNSDNDALSDLLESYGFAIPAGNDGTTYNNLAVDDGNFTNGLHDGLDGLATGSHPYSDVNARAYTTTFVLKNSDTDDGALPANANGVATNYDYRERNVAATLAMASTFNDSVNTNGCPEEGETITFTFTVTNTGSVNISVAPSDFNFISGPASGATLPAPINQPLVTGIFAPGDVRTYVATHVITQEEIDSGSILYEYNVTANDADTNFNLSATSNNDSAGEDFTAAPYSTTNCVAGAIEILSELTLNPDPSGNDCPDAGETVTITYTVTNTGFVTLSNIQVTESLTNNGNPINPVLNTATDVNNDLLLSPSEEWSYTATYEITQNDIDNLAVDAPEATLPATATGDLPTNITGTTSDAAPDRNLNLNINGCLAGAISIETNLPDVTNCPKDGDTIQYQFTIRNNGPLTLNNVVITEGAVTGLVRNNSTDIGADNQLSKDEFWTYTANYTVLQTDLDNGSLNNIISVTANEATSGNPVEPASSNTDLNFNVNNCLQAAIEVTLSSITFNDDVTSDGCPQEGETIQIPYLVDNTGAVTLSAISVADANVGLNDNTTIGNLAPNDPVETLLFVYTLTQDDINNGRVILNPIATGTRPSNLGGGSVSDTLAAAFEYGLDPNNQGCLDGSIIIEVTKKAFNDSTPLNGCPEEDESVTYDYRVTNNGFIDLSNLRLTAPLFGLNDQAVTVPGGVLAPGEFIDLIDYTYTLFQADIDRGEVDGNASIVASKPAALGGTVNDATEPIDGIHPVYDFSTLGNNCLEGVLELTIIDPPAFVDLVGGVCPDAGDQLEYKFEVQNTGFVTLNNIALTSSDLNLSNQNIAASLAPRQTASYTATGINLYEILQDDLNAGFVEIDATAVADTPPNGTTQPTDSQTLRYGFDGLVDENGDDCFAGDLELTIASSFIDGDGNGCPDVGDQISYTFTVSNPGSVTITDVDILPQANLKQLTVASGSDSVDPGNPITFTATYEITQDDIDATEVVNSYQATGNNTEGQQVVSPTTENTFSFNPIGNDGLRCFEGSLELEMTHQTPPDFVDVNGANNLDGCPDVDEIVNYTFVVTNNGPVTLRNVRVSPVNTSRYIISGTQPIAELKPGQSSTDLGVTLTATYAITQDDIDLNRIENQATATAINPSDNNATVGANDDDIITFAPNLSSDGGDPCFGPAIIAELIRQNYTDVDNNSCPSPGDTISYDVRVSNNGRVTLFDVDLERSTKYVIQGDTNSGGTLVQKAPIGSIRPNRSNDTYFKITYTITQADINQGFAQNEVTAFATTAVSTSPKTVDNTSALLLYALDDTNFDAGCFEGDVNIQTLFSFENRVGDPNCPDVGDRINYRVILTNGGIVSIKDVVVRNPKFSSQPLLLPNGQDTNLNNELDPNEPWEYTAFIDITQDILDDGLINTTTTMQGRTFDTRPTNEIDISDQLTVDFRDVNFFNTDCLDPLLDLTISSTFNDLNSDGCPSVDDQITYTYSYTNRSRVTLFDAVISDEKGILNINLGDLIPTATQTFTRVYDIVQADLEVLDRKISNTVNLVALNNQSGELVNKDAVDVRAFNEFGSDGQRCFGAELELIIAGGVNDPTRCAVSGDTVNFTFSITNNGPTSVSNLRLIPEANSGLTMSGPTGGIDLEANQTNTTSFSATYVLDQDDVDLGSVIKRVEARGLDATNTLTTTGFVQGAIVLPTTSASGVSCNEGRMEVTMTVDRDLELDQNGDGCPNVGDQLKYNFSVTNTGFVSLLNIRIDNAQSLQNRLTSVDGTIAKLTPNNTNTTNIEGVYTITQDDLDSGFVNKVVDAIASTGSETDNVNEPNVSNRFEFINSGFYSPTCFVKDLTIQKTGNFRVPISSTNCPEEGDLIDYTITVRPTSNTTLSISDVVVTDTSIDPTGNALVLTTGDDGDGIMQPTEVWIYQGAYQITQDEIDAALVRSTASVDFENISGNTQTKSTTLDLNLRSILGANSPCLVGSIILEKRILGYVNSDPSDPCPKAGDGIEYSITLTNNGFVSVRELIVTDQLLSGTIPLVADLAAGDDDNDGELDPSEVWSYNVSGATTTTPTYIVEQNDLNAGLVVNEAFATGVYDANSPVEAESGEVPFAFSSANFPASCFVSDIELEIIPTFVENAVPGTLAATCPDTADDIRFEFRVSAAGTKSIAAVEVAERFINATGAETTYTNPDTIENDINGDQFLDPGEVWVFVALYDITQDDLNTGTVDYSATAAGIQNGADLDATVTDVFDFAQDINPPVPSECFIGELALAVTGRNLVTADACPAAGDTVEYTLEVSNPSLIGVTDIVLQIPEMAPNATQTNFTGDMLNDGILNPTETWIYTVSYELTQADIDNVGVTINPVVDGTDTRGNAISPSVTLTDTFDLVANGGASATCFVGVLDLAILGEFNHTAGGDPDCPNVGDTITYSFELTNNGTVSLTDITVQDDKIYTSPIALNNTNTTSSLNDTNDQLEPGETWTHVIADANAVPTTVYVLTQEDINGVLVVNNASAAALDSQGNTVPNANPASNTVDLSASPASAPGSDCITPLLTLTIESEFVPEVAPPVGTQICPTTADSMEYRFTLGNDGTLSLTNLQLDELKSRVAPTTPNNVSITNLDIEAGGDINNNGLLDPGEEWVYVTSHPLTQSEIDANLVLNEASANAEDSQANFVATGLVTDSYMLSSSPLIDPECFVPEFTFTKSGAYNVTPGPDGTVCPIAGEQLDYTFVIENTGNVTLTNVRIFDLNISATEIALTTGLFNNTAPQPTLSSNLNEDGNLEVGEIWTYVAPYTLTIDDINAGVVDNSATATVDDLSGNTAPSVSATDTLDLTTIPNISPECFVGSLTVTKEVVEPVLAGECPLPNDTVTFRFTITNTSPNIPLYNVLLTNTLLNSGNAIDVSGVITQANGDANEDGVLDVGEVWTYDHPVAYSLTQNDINNKAINSDSEAKGNFGTNQAETANSGIVNTVFDLTTLPGVSPECFEGSFEFTKTGVFEDRNDENGCPDLDDVIVYTFTFTNTSSVELTNFQFRDPLLGINDMSPVPADFIPPVPGGGSESFTLEYVLTPQDLADGIVFNSAEAQAFETDNTTLVAPVPSMNALGVQADTEVDLPCVYDITISKTVSDLQPTVGDEIVFELTVQNVGGIPATDVIVEDDLASKSFTFVGFDNIPAGTTAVENTGLIEWNIPTLDFLAPVTLEIRVKVDPVSGGRFDAYTNTAEIVGSLGTTPHVDDNPGDNISTVTLDPSCLIVYNLISPRDGDPANDELIIDCIDQDKYDGHLLQIYNRWGTLLYRVQDYDDQPQRWSGEINVNENLKINLGMSQDELPEGTYFYILTFPSSSNLKEIASWIYLKIGDVDR